MASFESVKAITMIAASDFTGDLYKLVNVSADNTAEIVSAIAGPVAGIVGEEVLAGRNTSIVLLQGRVKVLAGGTITAGQVLIPAADGTVTGTTLAVLADGVMGIGLALTAGAVGDVIEALAQPMARSTGAT